MIFETDRLLIRKLQANDYEAFHDLQSNANVMKYVSGDPMNQDKSRIDLEKVMRIYDEPKNDFWVWAVERKSDGEMLGTCAIVVNENGDWELGFRLREQFWGEGYGKEITEGLLAHAFGKMGIEKILAFVDERNAPSVRILEQCMTFQKTQFNKRENCTERIYRQEKERWQQEQ